MQWQDGLVYGSVANEFTPKEVVLLTRDMIQAWFPFPQGEVIVGYDTRFQSDLAARTVSEVLAANHIPVLLAKEAVPWGAVISTMYRREGAGGVYITGGARAVEYNGIRFIRRGISMLSQQEWEVWKKNRKHDEKSANLDYPETAADDRIQFASLMDEYLSFIKHVIDIDGIKKSSLTVLVDAMYGGGQGLITRLFKNEKKNIEEIHEARHSMFGGMVPSPHGPFVQELTQLVVSSQKHMGLAWDAEGKSWCWINRTSQKCIPGSQIYEMLKSYIVRKSSKMNDVILSQDGILQSLLFLEMLIQKEE